MDDIRLAISEAAVAVHKICTADGVKFDTGRLIHTMDLLQQAKDTACVALILPFAKDTVDTAALEAEIMRICKAGGHEIASVTPSYDEGWTLVKQYGLGVTKEAIEGADRRQVQLNMIAKRMSMYIEDAKLTDSVSSCIWTVKASRVHHSQDGRGWIDFTLMRYQKLVSPPGQSSKAEATGGHSLHPSDPNF